MDRAVLEGVQRAMRSQHHHQSGSDGGSGGVWGCVCWMTVCPRERLEWCNSPQPTSSANDDDGYCDNYDEPSIGTNGSLFGGRSCCSATVKETKDRGGRFSRIQVSE
jgi:hypothetical protein